MSKAIRCRRIPMFPAVPTLVLSGDLDSVTSPEDARQAASQFPDVVHLILPNLTHVTAWTYSDIGLVPDGGDLTHCVQDIVRNFVKNLRPGDTSCVAKIRGIRTPPKFARSFTELTPVDSTAGNRATPRRATPGGGGAGDGRRRGRALVRHLRFRQRAARRRVHV